MLSRKESRLSGGTNVQAQQIGRLAISAGTCLTRFYPSWFAAADLLHGSCCDRLEADSGTPIFSDMGWSLPAYC